MKPKRKTRTHMKERACPSQATEFVRKTRQSTRKRSENTQQKCMEPTHIMGKRDKTITSAHGDSPVSDKMRSTNKKKSSSMRKGEKINLEKFDRESPLYSSSDSTALSPCAVILSESDDLRDKLNEDSSMGLLHSIKSQALSQSSEAIHLDADNKKTKTTGISQTLEKNPRMADSETLKSTSKISNQPKMSKIKMAKISTRGKVTSGTESDTLSSWFLTANNKHVHDTEILASPINTQIKRSYIRLQKMPHSIKIQKNDESSTKRHSLAPGKQMKRNEKARSTNALNTRNCDLETPTEVRCASRLKSMKQASTPCSSSENEYLFGFENLLKFNEHPIEPMSRVSPIVDPTKRKKKKQKPERIKNKPKPWKGVLGHNASTIYKNKKKKPKRRIEKTEDGDKVDISEIRLFEDEVKEEVKKKDNYFFGFDEEESPSKPKRSKSKKKNYSEVEVIEELLPWKEIMEHELVIESV